MVHLRFNQAARTITAHLSAQAALQNGAAPVAALKIVVVEGEDAVNVVQQRTAVAPVVEVRDRNDQPVAGAIVRFTVTRGRATFSGARTIADATNAGFRMAANGTNTTRVAPSAFIVRASSSARRVLPDPPGPVSVMTNIRPHGFG